MARYIDAEKLEKEGWSASRTYPQDAHTMVYETKKMTDFPTADVVEVVRCKDCKHWNTAECHSTVVPDVRKCMVMNVFTDPDQFCKYGERREDEESTKRTD